jgi:hypothetical protein
MLFLRCVGYFAADGFVVQTGDPEGPAEGFIDPGTGKTRTVPLEIMVDSDKSPVYGETLEVRNSYFPIYLFIHFIAAVNFDSCILEYAFTHDHPFSGYGSLQSSNKTSVQCIWNDGNG